MKRLVPLACILLLVIARANAIPEIVLEEEEKADSYCTDSWPPTPLQGAALWQRPMRPLVLISGIAGSMLHTPLGTFPETWKKLWIAFRTQNEVAVEYLSGYFNGSMVVERYGHQVVAREDGFGLCSIDNLDPDLVIDKTDPYYYHNMILYLISIGYVPGETLFGFPYDWRQSVRHAATLERLHALIHTLHNSTSEKQPIDIMTHSMGGLLMKSYVSRYLEDTASVLGRWTAIGTPWRGGGSLAYKAMISGYALDMTTIPIVDWGLSETVAHSVELNWPSAFELMPDVDHDPWWRAESLAAPPQIGFQVRGQDPFLAESSSQVKTVIQGVNSANMQVFRPGTPAVPNPVNMLAWTHADETREEFAQLSERLLAYRQELAGSMTFEVTSIEGSKVPTKYSLGFTRPVLNLPQLQTQTPDYTNVPGDGTVPYASSRSDGMNARHLEYRGNADHQRLLRTPEVFFGVRHALDLGCLLEGSWKVDIYSPSGTIFSTQYWRFGDEKPMIRISNNTLDAVADSFNTTLPDGTPISGTLDPTCATFIGKWTSVYKSIGTRILGTECNPSTRKIVRAAHGERYHTCIYGNWSNHTRFLNCDESYQRVGEDCVLIIEPSSPRPDSGKSHLVRNLIIVLCSIAGIIVLSVAVLFIWRAVGKRARDTEYRTLTIDDATSLNSDTSLFS